MVIRSFCLALALSSALAAQELVPRPENGQPDLPPLQCKTQNVEVDIQQQVARVRIEQVFINSSGQDLEAVYYLPLHESASISRFSYWVDGKEVRGAIHEKQEARQIYEQHVAKRRDPALLEHAGRNLFRVNIFPVSSKEPMRVVLEYSQLCPYENGKVSWRYPLAHNQGSLPIGKFTLNANVVDQKPISGIQVTSHGVPAELSDSHHGRVHFEQNGFSPDRDFTLDYQLRSQDFGVSFLTHRKPGQDGYFMLVVAPQEQTEATQVVNKDVIFVVDRSGSMVGEKIEQARAALQFCLSKLNPKDRFRIVTFSNGVEGDTELQPATSAQLIAASQRAQAIRADGGTNIAAALETAMQGFPPGPNQKVVLFLTDGLPSVGETRTGPLVERVATANRQHARLFAFGVGNDLDDYLLLKLASDHRGILQYVRGNESVESKISEFFAKISTPVLVNLKLDFGAIPVQQTYPETLPDVYKGAQLIVVGRYQKSGQQDLVLNGDINGKARRFVYPAVFPEAEKDNAFLERLWAKQRVDWAVDHIRLHGENPELKDQIIQLSKEHMFMTPYTSFLAMPKAERSAQAASSAPGYPTGIDPILSVQAPQDARVTAYFPWGETRALQYSKQRSLWQCRFIVPSHQRQGECKVSVVITLANGAQQMQTVCFEADDEAPFGQAQAHLHYHPKLGWQSVIEVQASRDTHRVMVRLADGRRLELKKRKDGSWHGLATGKVAWAEVTLLDHGHNRLVLKAQVKPR